MGKNKRLRAELERMMMDQFRRMNEPDPEIQRLLGVNQGIIDWSTNPTNTVKDIYKHPTLGAKLPVFQFARTNRDAGRIGRGIAGLGTGYKGMYAEDLALSDDLKRKELASGILEGTIGDELEGAQRNILALKGLDTQRRTSSNSLINSLYGAVDQRARAGGNFWRGLAGGALNAGMTALL